MRRFRFDLSKFILVFSLLVLLIMPSHQSLWIDEISTAQLAGKPTFSDWLYEMKVGHVSEHQMPFSMAFAWIMARLFGTSEFALRSFNLIWGAVAVSAFYVTGRKLSMNWLPLLLVFHPFFWYYMNEARPYAMQISCGAALVCSLVLFVTEGDRDRWVILFCISGFLLCGSSLLGVIPFGASVFVLWWIGRKNHPRLRRSAWIYLAGCFVLLTLLGVFYVWTLFKHSTGARQWTLGWQNIGFSLYEFCGFGGLGPPRDILRDAARSSDKLARTLGPYLAGLIPLALAYGALVVALIRKRLDEVQRKIISACIGVILLTFIAMFGPAYFVRWPFWGRHLAAVFPFVTMIIAIGLNSQLRQNRGKLLAIVFLILFAISSLELRFNPWHGKDDYRNTVPIARRALAQSRSIWWVADSETAAYYGLPLGSPNLTLFWPPLARVLDELPSPEFVFLSKRDIYDANDSVTDYLHRHDFELKQSFPAFKIYERSSLIYRRSKAWD